MISTQLCSNLDIEQCGGNSGIVDMAPIHQYESLLDTFHTSASPSLLQAISIAMANNFDKLTKEKSESGLGPKEIVCLRHIFSAAYKSLIGKVIETKYRLFSYQTNSIFCHFKPRYYNKFSRDYFLVKCMFWNVLCMYIKLF